MKSLHELEELAKEYTFKNYRVQNHQTSLVEKAFIDGYDKAMRSYSIEIKALIEKEQRAALKVVDYKQAIFKLQGDFEMLKDQEKEIEDSKIEKDLIFLHEMKQRAINAFDKRDISEKEMLFTMIDDWVHELRLKRASAKTGA